jgi:CubicO group peptidase (beta-lactamase class C family)
MTNLASDEAVTERIAKVENGLLLPVRIHGRPLTPMSLGERMAHYQVPAVSLAVLDQGGIEWARSYGTLVPGQAGDVPVDAQFQAGSISKSIAATAALRLVDRGLLTLDEPVSQRLRGWTLPENELTRASPVTLRGLLSHTAGANVPAFGGYAPGEEIPSLREILDGQAPANTPAVRIETKPGERWIYSGGGYTIVQQLLSDVTGLSFADLVHELILEPTGMSRSGYVPAAPVAAAVDYRGQPLPGGWRIYSELAAAGLWSTAADLGRFALALQASAAGQAGALLSPAAMGEMLKSHLGGGLGLIVQAGPSGEWFGHGGDTVGYKAWFVAFLDGGRGAAIMTSGDRGDPLIQELLRSLAQAYGWPGFQPRERSLGPSLPEDWARYAGRFALEGVPNVIVEIAVWPDHLRMTLEQPAFTSSSDLWPETDTRFFRTDTEFELTFERQADGAVDGLVINQAGSIFTARRVGPAARQV